MEKRERKQYLRLIYRRTFQYLGAALVVALLVAALLGGGVYGMHATCAAGFVLLCWGWFTYLKMTGMHFFKPRGGKKKNTVPFMLRKEKEKKPHRPSFRMDSADFDDDLTSATAADEENFTQMQVDRAHAIARAVAGAVLVAVSFVIPIS